MMPVGPPPPPRPKRPTPHEMIHGALAHMAIITSNGPDNPDPKKWWEHVVNEEMRTDAALGVVELNSEYVATNNTGQFEAGGEAYDPAAGGYVPDVRCGDPHPVHAGLVARAVNWTANTDDVIRVQVKWVGTTPRIEPPTWNKPWAGEFRLDPGDDTFCERCRRAIEGKPIPVGSWWHLATDLVCGACAEVERDRSAFRFRIAAGIGWFVAWAGGCWLLAANV